MIRGLVRESLLLWQSQAAPEIFDGSAVHDWYCLMCALSIQSLDSCCLLLINSRMNAFV